MRRLLLQLSQTFFILEIMPNLQMNMRIKKLLAHWKKSKWLATVIFSIQTPEELKKNSSYQRIFQRVILFRLILKKNCCVSSFMKIYCKIAIYQRILRNCAHFPVATEFFSKCLNFSLMIFWLENDIPL